MCYKGGERDRDSNKGIPLYDVARAVSLRWYLSLCMQHKVIVCKIQKQTRGSEAEQIV